MDQEAIDRGDFVVEPTSEVVEAVAPEVVAPVAEAPEVTPEAEAPAAEAPAATPAEPREAPMIPKARLDQVLAKNRQLEQELEARRQAEQKTVDLGQYNTKLEELEQDYMDRLLDGDKEGAMKLRAEMRQVESELYQRQVAQARNEAVSETRSQLLYDQTVNALEASYPAINPDSSAYNAELVGEVQRLQAGLMATGATPHQSLTEAVELVMARRGLSASTAAPAAAPAADRRVAAVQKNVAAAAAQPPAVSKTVGADHDKAGGALTAQAIGTMSDKEFGKLSDAELARLRGDAL